MFLIFDTETTGLPKNYNAPLTDSDNWPRLVQMAWQIHDETGNFIEAQNHIIKPEGFEIPFAAVQVHGISTERAMAEGAELDTVLNLFALAVEKAGFIIGHNVEFDVSIVGAELTRKGIESKLFNRKHICTKEESTDFLQLPGGKGGKYKWPNLTELHHKLFNEDFKEAHNASADVVTTARCFLELVRIGIINENQLQIDISILDRFKEKNTTPFQPVNISIKSNKSEGINVPDKIENEPVTISSNEINNFTHLHVHTQYSILDGAAGIKDLITKAKNDGMEALAITDHGNMFGVKEFHKIASKEGIKPILGCEVYIARRTMADKKDKIDGGGDHLVLLAKNETGYHNLIKLVSYGYLDGFYYHPRIDKKLLKKYHEGLIALTACLGGEIPRKLKIEGVQSAEAALLELKEIFGDDLYLELQRHKSGNFEIDKEVYEIQVFVNKHLIDFSKKHNIKLVATNDVHFIDADDADAQDRLLCISTGKDVDDPDRMRYTRQEWMKTRDEMKELFFDIPEALYNTQEIVDKVEKYKLDRGAIMPDFVIPSEFADANEYLREITYEGAKTRYKEITAEIIERIDFELETIKKMGFPGYFLIVWDFLKAAREMDVSVGPGRGSAAGSVVAYCLQITEIDPLEYDLLFERFLNPDRISMPDIDIDFDEEGRGKVLEYVVKKYGDKRVAHIITFGSMAAKSAIRDVARVQKLPLPESDRLAKLVPERPGVSLKEAYREVAELKKEKESGRPEISSVLQYAEKLEGSIRNVGTHACGIIIGRDDLENYLPIYTTKDSELKYITQFDGSHVENIGLLKMDFLGLKTLSIIKDAVENVRLSKNIEIDIDNIPLNDELTYLLYSKGETTGLFQFESDGMKKYLRELKPTKFEDLIAMNALYRPGPMD
ncbi:MAG: DNA polymerase III subunit alpha, partial [Bacteroidales bacterium]|nr:DNA polymerase III subunit alpha [Bacteroidales bacterium]